MKVHISDLFFQWIFKFARIGLHAGDTLSADSWKIL